MGCRGYEYVFSSSVIYDRWRQLLISGNQWRSFSFMFIPSIADTTTVAGTTVAGKFRCVTVHSE